MGVTRDPIFGPVILCGLGGIYVEVIKDVSKRLLPISKQDAIEMIKELKGYKIFTGIRNGVTYDVDALADTLIKVSNIASSLGDELEDFEINPLIVFEKTKGVMALDGLITRKQGKGVNVTL
ncbi:acyl-CoA synthetase (NDP forming) [Neobacillus niacini]|uniref:acetate--CoA ligase family protein n=1 Tax=Neobacillus niacini TaxID=86668 RepID=UPI002780CF58|nr:acetate--CoA ligase family protein [Neobacillus niacini]MDQ1002229.1 acyl-CoA synthetase (NDP forming) [Neobacillus niacini]